MCLIQKIALIALGVLGLAMFAFGAATDRSGVEAVGAMQYGITVGHLTGWALHQWMIKKVMFGFVRETYERATRAREADVS